MNLPPRPNQLVCWHVEPFDNHLNRLLQEAVGARHLAQSQDPVGRAWRRKSFWSSDGRRPTCRASQIKMKSSDWRLNQNKHAWRSQEQPPHCPGSHSVTGTASHPPCWFSTTPRKKVLSRMHLRDHHVVFHVQINQTALHSQLAEERTNCQWLFLDSHHVKITLQNPGDSSRQDFVAWRLGSHIERMFSKVSWRFHPKGPHDTSNLDSQHARKVLNLEHCSFTLWTAPKMYHW